MAQSIHRSVCRNLNVTLGGRATGTATPTITTGFNSIAGASAAEYTDGATLTGCVSIKCATSGGTLTVKRYKHTSAATTTLLASTVAGTVMWVAYGT